MNDPEMEAMFEKVAGQKFVGLRYSSGWPTLEFEDGTLITLTSDFGSDPVCASLCRPESLDQDGEA